MLKNMKLVSFDSIASQVHGLHEPFVSERNPMYLVLFGAENKNRNTIA